MLCLCLNEVSVIQKDTLFLTDDNGDNTKMDKLCFLVRV